MTPERWQQIRDVLAGAIALDRPARVAYLFETCGGDSDLQREVESLLAAHEAAPGGVLDTSARVPGWPPSGATARGRIGERVGPYEIVAELGHGGMADVFTAVRADGHYHQRVALKLVRAGYGSAAMQDRFRAERQILAGLDHANIARLFDGGTTADGLPYLVMELVDGTAIDAFCEEHAMPNAARLRLFLQVCAAVQYAHQSLVIHRDIKPGNILVTQAGVPKLLDFGIAKLLDEVGDTEETALRPFTLAYASPEQVRGGAVSTATDVYSLGVVLYRLLTGESPYGPARRTTGELSDAIVHEEPMRPSAAAPLRDGLRGDLDDIVIKALRKEPGQRYATVEQLADDVRRHLEGLPVRARDGTWSYRAGKFMRRHRAGVAAAAVVLAALVAGIVITAREARIAEANRRRADARFNDVRKLANSLIFEIHDSIQNLPGATDARKLVLQRSVEYLDGLAKEAANEPSLMRELAAAYDRVAQLQGSPANMNVGDTAGARANFRKALTMGEALALSSPSNHEDQVALASVYAHYADFLTGAAGDVRGGYDYDKRALAILDREAQQVPDDAPALSIRLQALVSVGMFESGNGLMGRLGTLRQAVVDLQRALVLTRQAMARAPSDALLRFREASIHLLIGQTLQYLGEREEALDYFRRGIALFDPLVRDGTDARAAHNRLVTIGKMGDTLLIDGRVHEAIPYYREQYEIAARMAAGDPHNAEMQVVLQTSGVQLGHALVEVGRIDEGMQYMRTAITGFEADRNDTPLRRSQEGLYRGWFGEALERKGQVREAALQYAIARTRLGELPARGIDDPRILGFYGAVTDRLAAALTTLGQSDEALRDYEDTRTRIEPLVRANPEDYELAYVLAETYTAEGALAAGRADRTRLASDKRAAWQKAAGWFRMSLDEWSRIPHPARTSTSGFEVTVPSKVAERLARCEHEIAAPR